jgi:hypothetical protein
MVPSAIRVSQRFIEAVTTPLPKSFPANETGLMTKEIFLKFRNPKDKHHPNESYDYTLVGLNPSLYPITNSFTIDGYKYRVLASPTSDGKVIEQEDTPVAVISNGVIYYTSKIRLDQIKSRIIWEYTKGKSPEEIKKSKLVKYIGEYVPLVSKIADYNRKTYNHLLQNILIKGSPLQIRSEGTPTQDAGVAIAILNPLGEIVARATNEWGATLLTVAQEYRKLGLGQVIGRTWYELNPSFTSGGFTQSGERNAIRLWEDRVREFLSRGWYSELIRQKRLTTNQVKEILSGLRGTKPVETPLETPKPMNGDKTLLYAKDSVFVVYKSEFLNDPDEKYILGYGFFRDNPHVGLFLYRIDYERSYQQQVNLIALQMAKDEGEKLYVGSGYGDTLELEGTPHVEQKDDYAWLTQDAIPIKSLAKLESKIRSVGDPYGERENMLLEIAETKWS